MQFSENILNTIGRAPLIKLHKVVAGISGSVLAKVETFSPRNSIKDRMAIKMIEDAEAKGSLKPGGTIIETTSRRNGIGLAMVANIKGYQLICVVSDKHPKEKINVLKAVGAKVVVCPADVEPADLRSCSSVSKRLSEEIPNSWCINQSEISLNSLVHYEQTASEIWSQTEGKINHFVSIVKTGATITSIGKCLKEKNPNIKIWGIDTEGVEKLSLPKNVDFSQMDGFVKVSNEDAIIYTQKLTLEEGIFANKSSGAAIKGLWQIKAQFKPDDVIVVLFHD
jgi:cystathionine beta-synthase